MKILVINFEYPPVGGGASPTSEEITKELYKQGHQVTVVTMAWGALPLFEDRNGILIHRIPSGRKLPNMSRLKEHIRFLINGRKFLKQHLARHTYDIIHSHFIISSGFLALWVKNKYGIPYVITPHGSDLPGYNPDHFKLMHQFTPPFIKRILRGAEKVTFTSSYHKSLSAPYIEERKTEVIPSGIRISTGNTTNKKNIILTTGRLLRRKGFHTLIQSVYDESINYEVHIAGDGPMMDELKQMAQGSQTPIIFHGWLDNKSDEYRQLLAEASIYCLVSSFENAPVSLLEAMAYGCAIITSDGTGCAEMVEDSGLLVPSDNPEALKKSIKELVLDQSLIVQYGKRAQKRVQNKFSWTVIGHQYENILREACKK